MPVKPPPLSLLRSSLSRFSGSQMTPNPTRPNSGSTRILSRVFPFRLRYHSLLSRRDFSTRPRPDSGPTRAPKSLVDDEAELSDWVTELRTNSYRAGVLTDDEDRPDRRGMSSSSNKRSREEKNDGFRDSGRDRGGGGRLGFRGSDDGLRGRGRGGNVRRGSGLGSGSRFSRRSDDDDEDDQFSRRKSDSGRLGSRGRGGDVRRGSGARGSGSSRRFGSESEDEDEDDDDEEEEEDDGNWRKKRGGMRGGRGGRGGGRLSFVEERKEEAVTGFVDLIGEGESESEEGSESDEIEKGSRLAMFGKEENVRASSPSASGSYLSETRFDQCTISPLSLKAIKDAGYENMTVVQEATLPVILKGKDVMAKARTGTGKTVAFLLPSIEVVVKSSPADRDQKRPPILVLVVCPTRELASQAAAEATKLLKYHPSIGVQVVIGGTRLGMEQKRMQSNPCQILVATPGRLKDHIENTSGFATRLMGVKVLVLDEADHLLDMGFRKDIERIVSAVPKQRQTLLFSATIPEAVRQVSGIALKRDHEYINTVKEGSEDTHTQVSQMHLVAPLEKQFPLLYAILKEHISDDVNYKVLVFCTTAMVTKLVANMLGELNLNVREIHSRKPQSYRTRVSDEFRKSKGLILVTSDVSARGVDYPDVSLVMQLGLPSDRQQYIHRLGRTGRKGKEGQGILLLAPWEESFLSSIKDLPISKAPVPTVDSDVKRKVEKALSNVDMKSKESAYQAWLGYYNSSKIVGQDKFRLVELANEFSRCMGLDTPPAIPKLVLGKMGLKNVPGLRSK